MLAWLQAATISCPRLEMKKVMHLNRNFGARRSFLVCNWWCICNAGLLWVHGGHWLASPTGRKPVVRKRLIGWSKLTSLLNNLIGLLHLLPRT
jgi:hypothetical protein